MNRVALQSEYNAAERVLYMAMELSDKHWKLVFSDGSEKRRHEAMEAGHRMELVEAIKKAKEKFGLSSEAGVMSCYEAGRDGFWQAAYWRESVPGRIGPIFSSSCLIRSIRSSSSSGRMGIVYRMLSDSL
ncbi:MAG: hypothetical protein ACREXX_15300 [Gammaproteobacteria bacterium]